MKVVITGSAEHPDSIIDNHFGRCAFFIIYDTQLRSTEYIPNPFRSVPESAAVESVRFLVSRGINQIITGELGQKAKGILEREKIQIIILRDQKMKISDIINLLNKK